MRANAFKWTDFEDDIIIQAVKESISIKDGLEKAAEVLGTSFSTVRNRWYTKAQKKMVESEQDVEQDLEEVQTVIVEAEIIERPEVDSETVKDVKDSLEDFLGSLSKLVAENRRLSEENSKLKRENKELLDESRDIKESYDYMLKVIDKARKLCLEDEERPNRLKYTIKDGTVVMTA